MKMSLKYKISLIVLAVLIVLFTAYTVISTTYNKNIYMPQIEKELQLTVSLNVEKINHQTDLIKLKTHDVTYAAALIQAAKQKNPSANYDEEIQRYLEDSITDLPIALGNGIWYEPYSFESDKKYYGPYAYLVSDGVVFTNEYSNAEYDYFKWDWYTMALPADWNRSAKRDSDWYYSAPYKDELLGTIITTESLIYDANGKIIGTSTVDWQLKSLLDFLENTKVTPDSHSVLVDPKGLIIANTLDKELFLKEKKDVVYLAVTDDAQKGVIKNKEIEVNGINYRVYYTITDADMLYGILVPKETIEAPIKEHMMLNILMAITLGVLLLLVLFVILSRVTEPLNKLNKAGNSILEGNLDTEVPQFKTGDEIEDLSSTITLMTGAIKFMKKESVEKTQNKDSKDAKEKKK